MSTDEAQCIRCRKPVWWCGHSQESRIPPEEFDRLLQQGLKNRRELHKQLEKLRPTARQMQMRLR